MSKTRFLKTKMLFIALLLLNAGVFAQVKTITGIVKDSTGKALSKASITTSKGAAKAVLSKDDGTFSIDVPSNTSAIIVSYTGYSDKVVGINGKANVDVILKTRVEQLEDVVVQVGYGTQKAKDVTGSVGSVKGSDIKNLPVQNIADAIQGRVAGVDVVQSTGEAGATTSQITIRGVSSLNQPDPLYVIDGVIQHKNPLNANGGPTPGSGINPKDIASIDVLKDASAAAIYGAAAAGGVIIITTKKGQGKPVLSFTSRYGITTPIALKLLDTAQYYKLDAFTNRSFQYADRDTLANSDWEKALLSNGVNQNYTLSVSGSSPATNYYISGAYDNTKGIYLNNSSELYSFTLNTDTKLSDHFKIGEQISAYQRNTSPVDYAITANDNPTGAPRSSPPFLTMPIQAIYGTTPGTYGGVVSATNGQFNVANPVAQILSKDRNLVQDNIQANVYGEAKLLRYFTFKATLGYTIYNEIGNNYNGTYTDPSGGVPISSLFKDQVSYRNLLNAYVLAFDKGYGKHFINALIGYEQYQGNYEALYTSETAVLPASFAYAPTSATQVSIAPGGYDPFPLVKSNFGRINYNYDGRYFASASVRRDADYIHFGPGKQAGIFPAFSAGWKINEESFVKRTLRKAKISYLKLRASYGEVGNNQIPAYLFLPGYSVYNYDNSVNGGAASNATSFSNVTYAQNQIANPNIQWEDTKETNIGLDGEWLNGKVYYTIEWYNKNTTQLLYNLPLPTSSGFASYYTNIGATRDRGVDIQLGYKDHYKALSYNISFTGSFNSNEVISLDGVNNSPISDGVDRYNSGELGPFGNYSLTRTAIGHPFGQFWGLKAIGIYQVNDPRLVNAPLSLNGVAPIAGDLIYAHSGKGNQITDSDFTYIGNPYPKFTYGINFSFNYKGFDLSMLWNGVLGADIYNSVKSYAESPFHAYANTTSKVFNTSNIGGDGIITSAPSIGRWYGTSFVPDRSSSSYNNYETPSSYFVESGNYLKLKNIQIGYSFSNQLLSKAHIRTARVFLMGNNVFVITKYSGADPELGSQNISSNGGTTTRGIDGVYRYPNVRAYAAGIDLSF
jgi:TonB-linked SusC/RagA family outer membrane protein